MCLGSITQKFKVPDGKVRWGWKVFYRSTEKGLCFQYYNLNDDDPRVPVGKWLKAKRVQRKITDTQSYRTGFHVFISRAGARAWVHGSYPVVKVKVRNVTYEGLQGGNKVMVAQEMLVPRQKRRK